ncbi:THxN family PEP-CTERM protein [Paracoccus caeni]|uniref:THxN family PEP-CTERM protein n=1 Tax=Paracoccus caeni TaxID=657651 RepID=A0A934SDR0_9RHOB|nr:THxN family PEP-CTERM protein [Paracoccus caeni]MBK4215484.1 THxN family PEP-CTERM protein [Paracoccus caeni]
MNMFKSALCGASIIALTAIGAQAATLTVTDISGAWSNVVGGQQVNINNGATSTVRWGTPTNAQSGYDFTPEGTPLDAAQDVDFTLGTFTHHNFPITAGTGISSASLDVTFKFYLGSDSSTIYTRTSQFVFNHWETGNSDNPCADGGTEGSGVNINGCADQVTAVTNPNSTDSFEIVDGNITRKYVFAVNGFDIGDEFWTVENQTNQATIKARFTYEENIQPAPIPLPAAAWMLMAGMGGLAMASRRRNRKS